jgi:hypothetical protein
MCMHCRRTLLSGLNDDSNGIQLRLRYRRTATSDAVVYLGGPAIGNGILAMSSLPSSLRNRSALLNPPSSFSIAYTGESCSPMDAAIAQSLSTSNLTYLRPSALFSLAKKRPFVYLNNSSRLIGWPNSSQPGNHS